MFDHKVRKSENRGFNGNLNPLYIFYTEYWKQVGQLLKYMLSEFDADRLREAKLSLLGAITKLKREIQRRNILTDNEKWWKTIVKPIIPSSVSPLTPVQQMVRRGTTTLTEVSSLHSVVNAIGVANKEP